MDKGVIPLVEFFSERGLKTKMSCEGHYPDKPNQSLFWIAFDESVTGSDLINFMKTHLSESGIFWSRGRFVDRIGFGWAPFHELCYIAANKEVADMDLEDFKKREKQ